MSAKQSSHHISALDGVRGMAITLVLVYHLLQTNDKLSGALMRFLLGLQESSWVGVDLFFVLSGFLITGILYDSLNRDGYFRVFYARRTLRIFPLYYGFLCLLFAFTVPLHLHWHGMQWSLLLYLQNTDLFTVLGKYHPSSQINLNHFWSLAVEEQFYLGWPLVIYGVRGLKPLVAITVGLSVGALILRSCFLRHGSFVHCFTACRADSLLIGGCLALLVRSRRRDQVLRAAKYVALLPVTILTGAAIHDQRLKITDNAFVETVGYSLLAITFACVIAECLRDGSLLQHVFSQKWLRWMGTYSYGIYVYHYSLDAAMTKPLRQMILAFSHSEALSVLGAALLITALTLLVSVLSFRFFESYFIGLKDRFRYGTATASVQSSKGLAA